MNQGHVALGFQKLHLPSGSLVFNGCTIDHGTRGTISNVGGKPQKILSTPPPQILMAAEENSLSVNSEAEEGALSRVLWGGRPTEHHGALLNWCTPRSFIESVYRIGAEQNRNGRLHSKEAESPAAAQSKKLLPQQSRPRSEGLELRG